MFELDEFGSLVIVSWSLQIRHIPQFNKRRVMAPKGLAADGKYQ